MQERRLGLAQATAINMIDMVGIGPFITLPMVIGMMNGPFFLYAWIAGAVLSFVDAMVWSELGAAFPRAGGSYNFLKEAYGPQKGGKMISFLFVWQTMIQAPLVIASAAIGFASYLSYLLPMSTIASKAVSGSVVILIVILLYRKIETIGKISVFLWAGVIFTLLWIIGGGLAHGNFLEPVKHMNDGLTVNYAFVAAIGFASVKSVYSYLGYYNICHLGGEIINPAKNIPRSMFISIAGIAILYLAMNISVTSVIPWNEAKDSQFVISVFMQRLAGNTSATIVTCLILWVAFASVFSATLGYSRIPYAAAADGAFFKVFAKLHPTRNFPHISLLFLGGVAFIFSLLFRLSDVISGILAMRILVQFIGQAVGLILLRRSRSRSAFPYKMPLFPLPVYAAILLWAGILISTGLKMVLTGLVVIIAGLIVYLVKARRNKEWPFQGPDAAHSTGIIQYVNAPREKVYNAFIDADAVGNWMVPAGMTSCIHTFEGHEGGTFRISLTYDNGTGTGKTSAHTDTYHGHFVKLIPNEQVVQAVEFETEDPGMKGEMIITVNFHDAGTGTEIIALHDHLPPALSPADNELGWRISFEKLAKLVGTA